MTYEVQWRTLDGETGSEVVPEEEAVNEFEAVRLAGLDLNGSQIIVGVSSY